MTSDLKLQMTSGRSGSRMEHLGSDLQRPTGEETNEGRRWKGIPSAWTREVCHVREEKREDARFC